MFKVTQLLLLLLFLCFSACSERGTGEDGEAQESSNVVKDYIRKPIDKADHINTLSIERDKQMREQLGE